MAEIPNDQTLIKRSLSRPEQFTQIFERHFTAVHQYLARRVGVEAADELSGEVFRVAFENRRHFDPRFSSARPWLYGIAGRHVLHWYRTAERRSRAYTRLANQAHIELDSFQRRDEQIDAANENRDLIALLETFSQADRETLLLFAWEDLSYQEISQALSIPIGTVKSRLARVRRLVREHIETKRQLLHETDGGTHRG